MDSLVVTSCAGSGELHALRLDGATGRLTPLQVLPLGGQLMPIAPTPDGRHLLVARRSAPLAAVAVAVHPGRPQPLQALGETPLPASMACLALDARGRWLFGASYGQDVVSISAVGLSGLAEPARQLLPTTRHAHLATLTPDQRWLVAPALGGQCLHLWPFNPETGHADDHRALTLPVPGQGGPRHLRWHPGGRFGVLLGELDAHLTLVHLDDPTSRAPLRLGARWPLLPPALAGTNPGPWAAELRFSPDGTQLWASERRHHRLSGFAVDVQHTTLTPLGTLACVPQPRGLAISPCGRWLLAASQTEHLLQTLRRPEHAFADDAAPPATHALRVGEDPNWIECWAATP